jgi:hypothetical protein
LKTIRFAVIVSICLAAAGAANAADSDTPATPAGKSAAEAPVKPGPGQKQVRSILEALHLGDSTKEDKLRAVLEPHFLALNQWRATNETRIKELWQAFDEARKPQKQDPKGAEQALKQIGEVYAGFKAEHDAFNARLVTVLSPEQIEKVKDVLTVNKVKVTYDAYGVIFHGLTEVQKEFILKNLKAAREEAIDAGSMNEKSAFFKKYKLKIQDYLTAQGYDVAKSYKEFGEKQKADAASRKATNGPADKD